MIRHKRTIEQKFKAIVAMIVAMGLVSGFTLQDGTINDAHSSFDTTYNCGLEEHTHGDGNCTYNCGKEEHIHESCDLDISKCKDPSHDHEDSCYNCGKEEHTHDEKCCQKLFHAHSEACLPCAHTNTKYVQYYKDGKPWHILKCVDCGAKDSATDHIQTLTCTDQKDGTHLAECNHSGCSYSAKNSHSDLTTPVPDGKGNHVANCGICGGVAKITPCEYGSWTSVGSGKHQGTCQVCRGTTEATCNIEKYSKEADGKYKAHCLDCNAEDVLSDDQGELVEKFYEFADKAEETGLNWSLLSVDTLDDIIPEIQAWEASLSTADKDGLNDLYGAYLEAEEDKATADIDKIADYVAAKYPMAGEIMAFLNQNGGIAPLDVVDSEEFKIQAFEKDTSTALDGAEYYIYKKGEQRDTSIVYVVGPSTIKRDNNQARPVSKSGDTIIIPQNVDIVIEEKTKPSKKDGKTYTSLVDKTMEFKVDNTPKLVKVSTGSEIDVDTSSKTVKIAYDVETIDIELKLFKDNQIEEIPDSVTNAKYTITNASDPTETKSWTRTTPMAICKTGDLRMDNGVLLVPTGKTYNIVETEAPSGYVSKGTTPYVFAPVFNPADMGITTQSNIFEKNGNLKAKLIYKEIPSITTKFLKKNDTTALTGCSVTLESDTANKGSVTLEPGDTIVIGTPANSMDISKSDKVITLASGKEIKILPGVGPLGYKNLEDKTFKFQADADGKVTITGGTEATWVVAKDGDKGLKIYFDTAPTIKFTKSGDGAPDKTGLIIKEKFGAQRTINVASATSPETQLADGEYSVTTTNAAKGYKNVSGTFKVVGGTVSSTASDCTGACEYKSDDTVNIKFTKDDKIPDIKVYKYPKKDGKDEPDTKKDALKGWSYTVEMYDGDETTDEKVVKDTKSSNWDEVDKISVTSSASKDYDTLDTSKLTVESYYRIKTGTDTYAYFYINSDGTVKAIKGNIDTNDDGDEVYLWDDDPDEDSDDVIAIHKVNNTGTNLSGAHLQIYLYSDSNTLVYGSSSSSTSSSTSNTSSSTNSSTSSSTNSSTNRSTSSSTTKAKTTPAKPSVATNDVKFDWTTTDKAKVIDIGDLEKGKNYTLREVSAPSGYETPAYDFVFKYGTDGKLTIVRNYNGLLSVTGNKLVLKNLTPTEAAATRPKTGDHSKLALWLDICIVMLGGLYLSGYSIFESFTEKKKVKVVAKKKSHNRRKR